MEAIMLIAKIKDQWRPLGEVHLIQMPRIGETIFKTVQERIICLKIVEICYNGDFADENSLCDVYAEEITNNIKL
jgi:hypothetical protein